MRKYRIKFDRRVKRDFKSIDPQDVPLLKDEIAVLVENPRPSDCKKLRRKNCDFYRTWVGKYRVIYSIKDEVLLIVVVRVGHRSHIYNKL